MAKALRVLLVEDSQPDAELALRELKRAGLDPEVRRVQTEPDFLRLLEEFDPEVVLSDFSMPEFDGMRALRLLREARPDTPFIFVSGTIGEEYAIRALQDGATDYVLKSNLIRLPAAVERALQDRRIVAERRAAEKEARQFRHAIDASVDSIYITDIDAMRFVYVNDAACQRLDYSRDQLLAMGPQDVLKADRDALRREYEQVIAAGGAGVRTQHRFVARDRTEGWTEIHRRALRTGDGWLVVTVGRDVSERRRAEEALRRFRLALDNSPDIVLIIDRATMRHVDANDTACALLGYAREELLRMGPADTLPVGRAELEREYDRLIASGGRESGGMRSYYRCKDGSRLPFESTRRVLRSEDRWLVVAISRDIRPRLAAEHTLREEQEKTKRLTRVHAVLSGINAAIVRLRDRDELFREACRVAIDAGRFRAAWIGLVDRAAGRVEPVASQGLDEAYLAAMPLALDEAASGVPSLAARAIRERRPVIADDMASDARIASREQARERQLHSLAMLPLIVSGESAGVLALYTAEAGFFDADEMKLLQELAGDVAFALEHIANSERADHLAYYDELTGLANRRLFLERLERAVHAAGHAPQKLAVVLFDIERLRTVNESLGRQAGDALLRETAGRLGRLAERAELGRISADHFAVLLQDVRGRSEVARRVAKLWHACFDEPYGIGGRDLSMSARAGVALFPNDAAEAESLLRNAEAALRKAKTGGEHYAFFEPALTERTAETLTLESELRRALARDEFVLHYQPKVDLESGRIVGAEALIRWQSPERGLVAPALFIRLMEETGLILEAGAWALAAAVADQARWRALGLAAPRVAVNVSAIQLRKRDFVDTVRRAIGAGPPGLDLEITESLVMEDIEANIEKLKAIRALGLSVAVDDFGTGYSSLGYLAKLPVQALKIDRSFIITMLNEPDTMLLVQTILSLAQSLKLKVVAEGVDDPEQAKILRLLRCDQIQGYLFSRPVPADEFAAMLREDRRLP